MTLLYGLLSLVFALIVVRRVFMLDQHIVRKGSPDPDMYRTMFDQQTCPECERYDLSNDASGFHYTCRLMNITPATPICLYTESEDRFVSGAYYHNTVWEQDLVGELLSFLAKHPGCGFIDIGANIGTYTLPAAAMGRNVLVVEPNLENVRRLHKAASLGGHADRVTVLVNAVSNKRGVSRLVFANGNVGGARTEDVLIQPGVNYSSKSYIKSITMNDLLPFCKFKMAVLKMDIEGSESRAFSEAERLFDNIDIPYVQMEWVQIKKNVVDNTKSGDRDSIKRMMSFLVQRGYVPSTGSRQHVLNLTEYRDWPGDMTWSKREHINNVDSETNQYKTAIN